MSDTATMYVILRQEGSSGSSELVWTRDGPNQPAASTAAAIRAAAALRAECDVDPEGTYIAVPLRSWKPLTVTVETTTRVKIG